MPRYNNRKYKRGRFSAEEDAKLREYVEKNGARNWKRASCHVVTRDAKQCRERWCGHLTHGVNKGRFTPSEDNLITSLALSGSVGWAAIAERVGNGRTANSIKNNWNQRLSKMLKYNQNGHVETQHPEAAQQQPSVVVQASDHAIEGTEYSSSVDRRNIPDIECAQGLLLLVTTSMKESMKENDSAERRSPKAEEYIPLINDRQVISSGFSFNGTAKNLHEYSLIGRKIKCLLLICCWSLPD
ncbi:10175_t:CDS:2 [Acaulospora morrowiae]|uniref:10175_t:CDS:1 n=1 Tax=Acaulospora morrowiae TaxID=94023 RepID=A0A9N9CVT1_9GLOM|nr:10175_t:CDS:2 [Acaulospora morrowiae]